MPMTELDDYNIMPKPTGAIFGDLDGGMSSYTRMYRYQLWRQWDVKLPWCMFIGLNPSTADETKDDRTIRRCIGFAKREGCGGLFMGNLFAFRSRDPKVLRLAHRDHIVGPHNDFHLLTMAKCSSVVVAAWGADPAVLTRQHAVGALLDDAGVELRCLGKTKIGAPKHPLYLAKTTPLEFWP